ncbi:GTP cyclohydrolase II [Apiospora arundinis]
MDSGKDDGQAGQQKQEQQPPQQQQHPEERPAQHLGPGRDRPRRPNLSALLDARSDDRRHDTQQRAAPSPSLLSPQFTPPATPGFATPTSESQPPRGVPVDTARDSSTKKRPRLLETLPEVQCVVRARIPTVAGTEMFLHLYTNNVDSKEHLAIVFGPHIRSRSLDAPREGETEMDRMVRGAYTGRLFPGRTQSGMMLSGGSSSHVEEEQQQEETSAVLHGRDGVVRALRLRRAARRGGAADVAARAGAAWGIIIYLRQEGRGIGLGEKLKAYNLQDLGSDTVEANLLLRHPADARSYGLATAMLRDLGQDEVRLLTNNPDKIRAVEGPNREVRVVERVAMVPLSWKGKKGEGFRSQEVEGYLRTKIEKMGHMLDMGGMPPKWSPKKQLLLLHYLPVVYERDTGWKWSATNHLL